MLDLVNGDFEDELIYPLEEARKAYCSPVLAEILRPILVLEEAVFEQF